MREINALLIHRSQACRCRGSLSVHLRATGWTIGSVDERTRTMNWLTAGIEFPSVALPSWEMSWFVEGFAVVELSRRAGSMMWKGFMPPAMVMCRVQVSYIFFPCGGPVTLQHLFPHLGLRLGFSGPQASHNFSCEPPASSHVQTCEHPH